MVKNTFASAEDARYVGLIPGMERSPGEENGHPLQYSCLENPMDTGAWRAKVRRVAKGWMGLSMRACTTACDYKARSYFLFRIQILTAGDLILLACRKWFLLKVSSCYFQKSLEGVSSAFTNQAGTCWHQDVH